MSRGSALTDTLVAVFAAALFVKGAVAAAHLQAAGETAQEAAAVAAAWAARYGDAAAAEALARALAPGAAVAVDRTEEGLAVSVLLRVPLAGPNGQVAPAVTGRAVAAVSPYRSNRG